MKKWDCLDRLTIKMDDGTRYVFKNGLHARKGSGGCTVISPDGKDLGEFYVKSGVIICSVTDEAALRRKKSDIEEMFEIINS